jgi:hypothetical protein
LTRLALVDVAEWVGAWAARNHSKETDDTAQALKHGSVYTVSDLDVQILLDFFWASIFGTASFVPRQYPDPGHKTAGSAVSNKIRLGPANQCAPASHSSSKAALGSCATFLAVS